MIGKQAVWRLGGMEIVVTGCRQGRLAKRSALIFRAILALQAAHGKWQVAVG